MHDRFIPKRRLSLLFAASALTAGLFSAPVCAADWPDRAVTVVVPFSAGGTTDVVGRLIANKLGQMWGQSVVIENKLGAGGNIGSAAVAQSKPDGYTILLASGSILTVNPHLYASLPFDVDNDFLPVTNIAQGPMVVVTAKKVKVKTLQELLDMAKKNPKKLNMGSAGMGSQVHMAGENFSYAAKVEFTHVPYRGEAAGLSDLLAGQIDLMVGNIGAATPHIQSGMINVLAVTSKDRAAMLPDVPTVSEAGVPGFENYGWFGFVVPKGTPNDIVRKIQQDTVKVLAMKDVKEKLSSLGMQAVGNSSEEFANNIKEESDRWAKVIKERNITISSGG
ncbi:tripartite tricarboxylate transporter substrate binding protein [Alcaligenaceae bacterium]|nr:tripartite tricarboxylate transporter substrate binding protein [Alcaligenaceae bacterium]